MKSTIKIDDEIISNLDDNIKVEIIKNNIIITPQSDTSLEIVYLKDNINNVEINLNENIHFDLFELKYKSNNNIKYTYNLDKYSSLNITKFYDVNELNEDDIANLNGEYANIKYTLKTISNNIQTFNLELHHNNKNTISNVINSGVNINGSINFNVKGIVPKDMVDSELDQNNRIITFNDNKCTIEPILLIDENDVVANHSALIGKFNDEELFYLKSRGIDEKSATTLLVKGFLLSDLKDERLDKIIEKYWG